jgi:hypothetical protein
MNTVQTSTETTSPTHEQSSKEKTTSENTETPAFEAILAIACILALIGIKRMGK